MKWFTKRKLTEKRPLPVGVPEFHEWSERIISGACLPKTATRESLKFALANILINLPPNLAFEEDVYFIHCLRKAAANQVADFVRTDIRDRVKKEKEQNSANVTPPNSGDAA